MKLAVVIGQIVCTVRHPGLESDKLLLVEMIDRQGRPNGEVAVATDSIGAGNGEWGADRQRKFGAACSEQRSVTGRSQHHRHCG